VEDVRVGTLRILARVEAFIREHADQWTVFSDIWPVEGGATGVEYNAKAVIGHETQQ
jgi:hypothetical protein